MPRESNPVMANVDTKLARAHAADNWVILELRAGMEEQHVDEDECKNLVPSPPLISKEQKVWTAMAEPRDIDYRLILERDMQIRKAFAPETHHHFPERIFRYGCIDLKTENHILRHVAWQGDCRRTVWGRATEKLLQRPPRSSEARAERYQRRVQSPVGSVLRSTGGTKNSFLG